LVFTSTTFLIFSVHSAHSVNVESWWVEKGYVEANESSESLFYIKINIGIGNKGLVPITIANVEIKLILNDVDMGALSLNKTEIIPGIGWKEYKATYLINGSKADYLSIIDNYDVHLILKGESAVLFYKTSFEVSNQKKW
jgi:LEA14-like dessication related protein